MNFKRIALLLAAVLVFGAMMSFVACDGGEGEQTTQAATEAPEQTTAGTQTPATEQTTEAETESGKVTYTVTVVDANGAPVKDVAVQFCDDNGCRMPVATNAQGTVTLTEAESNFHVTLASVPAGYAADATEYYFDGALELTITLQAE